MKHLILVLLFLIIHPVSAQEYVVRYTIKSTAGYHSSSQAISPSPTESKITGGVKAKGQNISVVGDLRGDSSSIDNVSEKTETRKIARINPPKINKEIGDTIPQKITPKTDIEKKICDVFGSDCPMAIAICKAECGCRENAVGDGSLTFMQDGIEYGKSYGIFQIRHLPGRPSPEQLLNADFNIEYAYNLYKRSGFNPWSVFTSGSYLRFL